MDLSAIDKIHQDVDRQILNDNRDKVDLENVLRSAGDASGFNREEYPLLSELGVPHIVEWREQKRVPIPRVLLDRAAELQSTYSCGFFEQINRAWITIDRAIFLWNFDDASDLSYYELLEDEAIISCALVNPRGKLSNSEFGEINHILALATPSSFVLLGVLCRPMQVAPDTSYRADPSAASAENQIESGEWMINVLAEPLLRVSNEQIYATSICGTRSGRILIGGHDGHIYELEYELESSSQRSGWFSMPFSSRRVHKLVCHTRSLLTSWLPIPSVLSGGNRSGLRTDDSIVELAYEPSKSLLFSRAQRGTISAFFLGGAVDDSVVPRSIETGFSRFATIGENELHRSIAKLTRNEAVGHVEVVRMFTLPARESKSVSLIMVTNAGSRVYAAVRYANSNQPGAPNEPSALLIGHVRFATGLHIQHAALTGPQSQPAAGSGLRGYPYAYQRAPTSGDHYHSQQGLGLVGSLRSNCSFAYHSDGVDVLVSTASASLASHFGNPHGHSQLSTVNDRVHFVSGALFDMGPISRGLRENVESFELDGRVWSVLQQRDRERVAILTGESVTIFKRSSPLECFAQLLSAQVGTFPRGGVHFDEVRAFASFRRAEDAALLCLRIAASANTNNILKDAALDCIRTLFGETRLLDAVRMFIARSLKSFAGLKLFKSAADTNVASSTDLANQLALLLSTVQTKSLDEPISELRRLHLLLRDGSFRRLVSSSASGASGPSEASGTGSVSVAAALRDNETFVDYIVNVLSFWRILIRHNVHQILPYIAITSSAIAESDMNASSSSAEVLGSAASPTRSAASLWNYFALYGLFLPRRGAKNAASNASANANLIERLRSLTMGDLLVRERDLLLTLVNALINHYMNAAAAACSFLPPSTPGGTSLSMLAAPAQTAGDSQFSRLGANVHNTSVRADMSLAYDRDDALESISMQLERDCPLLFTRDDARLARAESLMHFAFALTNRELTETSPTSYPANASETLQRVRAEKEQLVREALLCLKQVENVERLDLERLVEQLVFVRCYSGAFELLESTARRIDPRDRALLVLYSNNSESEVESNDIDRRIFEARITIYDYATRIFSYLDRLSKSSARQNNSADQEKTGEKQSVWTSLLRFAESWSVGDILRERFFRFATRSRVALERAADLGAEEARQCFDFCLSLVRESSDELLHAVIYEYFVRKDATEKLAGFDSSPFLETYLLQSLRLVLLAEEQEQEKVMRTTGARLNLVSVDLADKKRCKTRYDATWRFYERKNDQLAVSRVLAVLADRAPTLSLDERIEYLSRAALRSASQSEPNSLSFSANSSSNNNLWQAQKLGNSSKMALAFASAFGEALGASPAELASALEDKLQVALVQRAIQQELSRIRRFVHSELNQHPGSTDPLATPVVNSSGSNSMRELLKAIEESVVLLDGELMDTSSLYSEFAERFGLHEMRLALVRVSDFTDESVIGSIWESIIADIFQPPFADPSLSLAVRLGDSIARLHSTYALTELYFPTDYILFLIESAIAELPTDQACNLEDCPCLSTSLAASNKSSASASASGAGHVRGRVLVTLFARRLHVSLARLADSYAHLLTRCGSIKESEADPSATVKRKTKRRVARLRSRIVQALVCIYEEFLNAVQLVDKWDRARFVQEGCDLLSALIVDLQSSADALNRSSRLALGTSMSDSFADSHAAASYMATEDSAQLLARMRSLQQRLDALNA